MMHTSLTFMITSAKRFRVLKLLVLRVTSTPPIRPIGSVFRHRGISIRILCSLNYGSCASSILDVMATPALDECRGFQKFKRDWYQSRILPRYILQLVRIWPSTQQLFLFIHSLHVSTTKGHLQLFNYWCSNCVGRHSLHTSHFVQRNLNTSNWTSEDDPLWSKHVVSE
jgi:hypothetical protein